MISSTISKRNSGFIHFVKNTISSTVSETQNASIKIYSGREGSIRGTLYGAARFLGKIKSNKFGTVNGIIT